MKQTQQQGRLKNGITSIEYLHERNFRPQGGGRSGLLGSLLPENKLNILMCLT